MWLDKLTLSNLKEGNNIAKQRIIEIQRIARHPLIMIMGASGVWKDTIIKELLKEIEWVTKMKRATSREIQERDKEWDFEYFTSEEMWKWINAGEILFAYDSHREDWTKYWLLYNELKKLEEQPLITVMGQGWLEIKKYIPVIVCCITRAEEDIKNALLTRSSDNQTQKNIQETKKNITEFLDKPLYSQIIIENTTGDINKTVSEIKEAIKYFEKGIRNEYPDILNAIFNTNIVNYIYWEDVHTSFKQNITQFITDEKGNIDKYRVNNLVHFMFTHKFSHYQSYFTIIKDNSHTETPKGINTEISIFYEETANLLYNKGFPAEAKKIMLQIGEPDYIFTQEDKNIEANKIDIDQCAKELASIYNYSYKEKNKLIFIHNSYAFWKSAIKLAQKTLNLLLRTKEIKIEKVPSMYGIFRIKLLVPYNDIKCIECEIIKDSP